MCGDCDGENRRRQKPDVKVVEAQRYLTVREILLDGIGGTLTAIAAMRFALGSFFVLSGIHKLTNKERHKTFAETLRVLGIPRIGILQWFVPGVEFFGGLGVAFGFLTPLAALGLLVICSVALLTNSPTMVASYKPIDRADYVDDWLYQPEMMYALMLLYFIAAGAGPVSLDQLLKNWIG
jgi:putative oxidoreductase